MCETCASGPSPSHRADRRRRIRQNGACALCHDEDIVENFDDGILWVTLGHKPDLPARCSPSMPRSPASGPGFTSAEDAAFQLGQKLEERTCLLVIDDVCDAEYLRPVSARRKILRASSPRTMPPSRRKLSPVNVDEMRYEEAIAMLSKGASGLERDSLWGLASRLGEVAASAWNSPRQCCANASVSAIQWRMQRPACTP